MEFSNQKNVIYRVKYYIKVSENYFCLDFLNPFVTKVSSNKLMVIDLRFSTET